MQWSFTCLVRWSWRLMQTCRLGFGVTFTDYLQKGTLVVIHVRILCPPGYWLLIVVHPVNTTVRIRDASTLRCTSFVLACHGGEVNLLIQSATSGMYQLISVYWDSLEEVVGYDMPTSDVHTLWTSGHKICPRCGRASDSNRSHFGRAVCAAVHLRVQAHESKKPRQKQDMFEALFNPKSFTQVGLLRHVCSS